MLRSDWARDGVAIYARGDINMGADSVHIAPINLAFTWNLEMDQIAFGTDSFAENPEPRVPCVLLLDVSSSMAGERIQTLNDGVRVFRDELVGDSLAAKRVETAIVTFGQEVKSVCDFVTAENFYPPTLEPSGATPMGEGLNLAIDMLEERKRTYKANGISYYRPWVFLISDGAPNDPCWEAAARRAVDGDRNKSFAMFAVGVQDADMEVLKKFSNRAPLALKGLQFREMFLWLSSSLKSVSRSTPGEDVPLQNPTGPSGWATV